MCSKTCLLPCLMFALLESAGFSQAGPSLVSCAHAGKPAFPLDTILSALCQIRVGGEGGGGRGGAGVGGNCSFPADGEQPRVSSPLLLGRGPRVCPSVCLSVSAAVRGRAV